MKKYILSLDAGTTSNRAILFDHTGKIVNTSQREFKQIFPKPGWVEHDPVEIWTTQKYVASDVLTHQGVNASEIAAIGITNQRETTIIWDRETGLPVYNAIVWQDRRTAEFCDKLKKEGHSKVIQEKTGLVVDAYFSGSKIRWILDNVTNARTNAEKGKLAFGTVDTWLVWCLTRGKMHVTDVSNASRTMLFNIHELKWDKELLKIFKIPEEILPEVKDCSGLFGNTEIDHFGAEIPVSGIAGDQQAALFGQMCTETGMVKNTYGTGCFVIMNTGKKVVSSKHNLLATIGWKINDEIVYALEGSIFIGGAVVQWLRDKLYLIHSSSEIEQLAGNVKNSGGVFFVPAFVGLGAPHWDQYATGTIIGINRDTSSAHIARAALEAIAFQSMDVINTMSEDSGITISELRVDGGAAVNDLLMQIQANAIQKKVIRPKITETTALGAAYLAGLAVNYWDNIDEIKKQWQVEKVFTPEVSQLDLKETIHGWKKALERSRSWYSHSKIQ
jgi:glycerol kinase